MSIVFSEPCPRAPTRALGRTPLSDCELVQVVKAPIAGFARSMPLPVRLGVMTRTPSPLEEQLGRRAGTKRLCARISGSSLLPHSISVVPTHSVPAKFLHGFDEGEHILPGDIRLQGVGRRDQ